MLFALSLLLITTSHAAPTNPIVGACKQIIANVRALASGRLGKGPETLKSLDAVPAVEVVALSPDGERKIVCTHDGNILIFDTLRNHLLATVKAQESKSDPAVVNATFPKNTDLAIVTQNGSSSAIDLRTGKETLPQLNIGFRNTLASLELPKDSVTAAVMSPNQKIMYYAARDPVKKITRIFGLEIATGRAVETATSSIGECHGLTISPDARRITLVEGSPTATLRSEELPLNPRLVPESGRPEIRKFITDDHDASVKAAMNGLEPSIWSRFDSVERAPKGGARFKKDVQLVELPGVQLEVRVGATEQTGFKLPSDPANKPRPSYYRSNHSYEISFRAREGQKLAPEMVEDLQRRLELAYDLMIKKAATQRKKINPKGFPASLDLRIENDGTQTAAISIPANPLFDTRLVNPADAFAEELQNVMDLSPEEMKLTRASTPRSPIEGPPSSAKSRITPTHFEVKQTEPALDSNPIHEKPTPPSNSEPPPPPPAPRPGPKALDVRTSANYLRNMGELQGLELEQAIDDFVGKNPRYTDAELSDAMAKEVFRTRQRTIGASEDATTVAAEVQAAFEAWEHAGRPPITPKLLRTLVDPVLNSGFAPGKKAVTVIDIQSDAQALQNLGQLDPLKIDEAVAAAKKRNPTATPSDLRDAAMRELIRARESKLGLRASEANENAAYGAWYSAGRPRITARVLEDLIDPGLSYVLEHQPKVEFANNLKADADLLTRVGKLKDADVESAIKRYSEANTGFTDRALQDVAVTEIIRARQRMVGAHQDPTGAGTEINTAFKAWNAAGRPALTPKVLDQIIDPRLNPALFAK